MDNKKSVILEPQKLRIRVTCTMSWTNNNDEKCAFNADNAVKNTQELDSQKLARYIDGFENKTFVIKEETAIYLIKQIYGAYMLYSLDGSSQAVTIIDKSSKHGNINVKFLNIEIFVEDGEASNEFKKAYPESQRFVKIDITQYKS